MNQTIANIKNMVLKIKIITKKWWFIMKGSVPDYTRVTYLIINDIKQGKISGITFDRY